MRHTMVDANAKARSRRTSDHPTGRLGLRRQRRQYSGWCLTHSVGRNHTRAADVSRRGFEYLVAAGTDAGNGWRDCHLRLKSNALELSAVSMTNVVAGEADR